MNQEKIKQLIQEDLENCWRLMAKTNYLSIYRTNAAMCMDSGTYEPLLNSVIRFSPTEKNLMQEIEKTRAYYREKHLPFCWWIPQGPLFDRIDHTLTQFGFGQTMEVKGMALDITSISTEWTLPDNIRLVLATTPQQIFDWMDVLRVAFDMDEKGAQWYKKMTEKLISDSMLCYVAYCGDKPVSSLTLFLGQKVASFYNVGTIPDFRGKGLTTSMTLYCLDIARKKGYTWATLQANPNSVRLYTRMGFNTYIDYRLYFQ